MAQADLDVTCVGDWVEQIKLSNLMEGDAAIIVVDEQGVHLYTAKADAVKDVRMFLVEERDLRNTDEG